MRDRKRTNSDAQTAMHKHDDKALVHGSGEDTGPCPDDDDEAVEAVQDEGRSGAAVFLPAGVHLALLSSDTDRFSLSLAHQRSAFNKLHLPASQMLQIERTGGKMREVENNIPALRSRNDAKRRCHSIAVALRSLPQVRSTARPDGRGAA
ncbi:uncharacterized protein V6R79_022625 [Siganus canaliculatus]